MQLQGQLIDQLLKWHGLPEKGGIDQAQYAEMQENLMKNSESKINDKKQLKIHTNCNHYLLSILHTFQLLFL